MTAELVIGIDVGTASSKGVLCDASGAVLATAVREHVTSFPQPGWVEHDADGVWWADVVSICRALLSGPYSGDDVAGIAVSAIGPCMLPVDEAGCPLRPAVLYGIDTRATEEITWLNTHLGREEIFALGGAQLTSQAVGPKIRWLREHEPDIYARTATIHSSSGYIVYRLTGQHVVDRHSAAYYTPLYNPANGTWSDRFAEHVVDPAMLPEILDAHEIAGHVTRSASEATGLRIGTPVTTGTMDAVAEAVSAGVDAVGDMLVMYGSTLFLVNLVDEPRPDERIWNSPYCLPDRIAITGGLATSGLLTTWFRDMIGEDRGVLPDYADLGARASAIAPGCDGLVCLPYFAGERSPIHDPHARGLFAGLTLKHTQGHLYRAILEAVGFGFRHNLEVLRELDAMPRRIVAAGGGVQNLDWVQMLSSITGEPQQIPRQTIGASYGDAFLAALAVGLVADRAALGDRWVVIDRVIEPDPNEKAIYDEIFGIYLNLYRHTMDDLHALHRFDVR